MGTWVGVTAITLGVIQLLAIVFVSGQIYNRLLNAENRIMELERDLSAQRNETITLKSMETKLGLMQSEIERVRSRLDSFIDGRK